MKSSNLYSWKWMLLLTFGLCVSFLARGQQAPRLDTDKADLSKNTVPKVSKPASLSWAQFEDSIEHAFSLSVPQGWRVQGGLFRLGFSDARAMISIKSPDGKIDLRIGDVTIPSYTPPSKYRPREGQVYDLGAEAQLVIAKYRTGSQFAVLYSQARFGTLCQHLRPNPIHIDFTMPDYSGMDFTPKHASAGQIDWLCQTSDGPRVALTFTRTIDVGQTWGVLTMVSLVAPPDQVQRARDIALRCVRSLKLDPKWIDYQRDMDREGLEYLRARQEHRTCWPNTQIHQFESRIHEMQDRLNAFELHESIHPEWGGEDLVTNALNGISPTTDPLSHEHRILSDERKKDY